MIIDVGKDFIIVIVNGVKFAIRLLDNSKDTVADLVSWIIEKEW